MADPPGRTKPNRDSGNDGKRLNYAFDTTFLSGSHPPDSPNRADVDSESPLSSDSEGSDSDVESKRFTDLAASFRVFSESMLRMELLEMEMMKSREASRYEAEKRRVESEVGLTQMLSRTQLQIASILSRTCTTNRKRKRSTNEDDSSTSAREGAMLLSLLQCNLF